MSPAALSTTASLESQPPMPVRRLHNFIYCPRLFYFQWVENIFQENADTVAGSLAHRNVDAPSRLDDPKGLGLSEGAKLRSLRLQSESLGLIGVVDIVEGGPDGAEIVSMKGEDVRKIPGQQVRAIYCYGAVQMTAQTVETCLVRRGSSAKRYMPCWRCAAVRSV